MTYDTKARDTSTSSSEGRMKGGMMTNGQKHQMARKKVKGMMDGQGGCKKK